MLLLLLKCYGTVDVAYDYMFVTRVQYHRWQMQHHFVYYDRDRCTLFAGFHHLPLSHCIILNIQVEHMFLTWLNIHTRNTNPNLTYSEKLDSLFIFFETRKLSIFILVFRNSNENAFKVNRIIFRRSPFPALSPFAIIRVIYPVNSY